QGEVEIERDRRMLLSDRWRLQRVAESEGAAPFPTVAALVARLFSGADRSIELAKKNASRLQRARQAHVKALQQRLQGSHYRRNVGSIIVAVAIALGTAVAAFGISGGGGVPAIFAVCFFMALVLIAFGWLVHAPTL